MYLKTKNISWKKLTAKERANEIWQSHTQGLVSGSNHNHSVSSSKQGVSTNHLSDHHHIGPQIFVDTKDVQDTDVPEDNIHTVDHSAIAHVWLLLQAKDCSNHEHGNGHKICDVPVLLKPNFYFLAEFAWFWHEDLKTKNNDRECCVGSLMSESWKDRLVEHSRASSPISCWRPLHTNLLRQRMISRKGNSMESFIFLDAMFHKLSGNAF